MVKNRVHLDLNVSGGREAPPATRRERVDAEVERLLALGVSVLNPMENPNEYFVVMRDLEENEFCVQ